MLRFTARELLVNEKELKCKEHLQGISAKIMLSKLSIHWLERLMSKTSLIMHGLWSSAGLKMPTRAPLFGILVSKVGQTDVVLICDRGSLVGRCVQDCESLRSGYDLCQMVSIQTRRQHCDWLMWKAQRAELKSVYLHFCLHRTSAFWQFGWKIHEVNCVFPVWGAFIICLPNMTSSS